MSADNYLFVRKWRGKYYIEQRFASNEYDEREKPYKPSGPFENARVAIFEAHALDGKDYFEYGVSISPAVLSDFKDA